VFCDYEKKVVRPPIYSVLVLEINRTRFLWFKAYVTDKVLYNSNELLTGFCNTPFPQNNIIILKQSEFNNNGHVTLLFKII